MADRVKRRRSRGRAWYWKQTDSWYYTAPGSRKRVRLLGLDGLPLSGPDARDAADLALARLKAAGRWRVAKNVDATSNAMIVARVCSEDLVECRCRVERGVIGSEHFAGLQRYLNAFAAIRPLLLKSARRFGSSNGSC